MTPQRRAARVVLLDPENRVLLMRYDDEPPNGSHWWTLAELTTTEQTIWPAELPELIRQELGDA